MHRAQDVTLILLRYFLVFRIINALLSALPERCLGTLKKLLQICILYEGTYEKQSSELLESSCLPSVLLGASLDQFDERESRNRKKRDFQVSDMFDFALENSALEL